MSKWDISTRTSNPVISCYSPTSNSYSLIANCTVSSITATAADSFTEFVLWTIGSLKYELIVADDVYRLHVPEIARGAFADRTEINFSVSTLPHHEAEIERLSQSHGQHAELQLELLTPDSPLWLALLSQYQALGRGVTAQPSEQSCTVHEIAQRLFPAYSILGGHIHLGGCVLEDRPFVRLTFALPARVEIGDSASIPVLVHRFFDAAGREITAEEVEQLGMNKLVPAAPNTPRLTDEQLTHLLASAEKTSQANPATRPSIIVPSSPAAMETNGKRTQSSMSVIPLGPLWAATIVWCKYTQGKLTVTIGEKCEEFPFAGWANALEPSALTCPQTGERTHALAATQAGVIAAANQIARCSETGERVLKRELLACSVSGKLALPDRVVRCPVCEEPVLRSALIECPVCHQHVSPDVLTRGICRACSAPPRVEKTDARLARLFGEYPQLDHWNRWKLSETATVYIAQARSLWRRVLLVVDKQTLEVEHIATAGLLSRRWTAVAKELWDEWLK
jgi:hypothetical protein